MFYEVKIKISVAFAKQSVVDIVERRRGGHGTRPVGISGRRGAIHTNVVRCSASPSVVVVCLFIVVVLVCPAD